MQEILTVSNLFSLLTLVVGWSIRNELHHIRENIGLADKKAEKAHERLDSHLQNHA